MVNALMEDTWSVVGAQRRAQCPSLAWGNVIPQELETGKSSQEKIEFEQIIEGQGGVFKSRVLSRQREG